MKSSLATIEQRASFDDIIDVRSPSEFAEDHIPGAINCPVLDDAQRAQIGTLYKQASPFEAKKMGAALVSINIAHHLQTRFLDKPKSWRPLIYCWRGGNRSGSMTTIFRAIGWAAHQLEGGYKAYRSHVVEQFETLPDQFAFKILCGATGSAKTRVLQALATLGEQTLDLETLASHKGSILGVLPDHPQPTQKWFESQLLVALAALDHSRPVYVEAESRKIGKLHVPEGLITAMRRSPCIEISASTPARVAFLQRDYDYFLKDPAFLSRRLDILCEALGKEVVTHWQSLVDQADWKTLVSELLERHYDPLYRRSQDKNYVGYLSPEIFDTDDLSEAGILGLANTIQSRMAHIA